MDRIDDAVSSLEDYAEALKSYREKRGEKAKSMVKVTRYYKESRCFSGFFVLR